MSKKRKPNKSSKAGSIKVLTKKARNKRREELLEPFDVEEFFAEGSISINKMTCKGLECKLCIKVCPTSALFWKFGEVGIIEELCIYCGACVLSCIVDDCIKITRKRATGEVESFSKPKDFTALQHSIDAKKRHESVVDTYRHPRKHEKRK